LSETVHEPAQACLFSDREKQMHVIRHEAVGVERGPKLRDELPQQAQIDEVIGRIEKTRDPVIRALHDVNREFGDDQSSVTGHIVSTVCSDIR
jgi:hypothetical protein